MGGHPYWYFTPYEGDLQKTLDTLREREFKAGRYNPVTCFPSFGSPGFFEEAPGAGHATINEAREEAEADGTRSILDIERISDEPDYCAASPFPSELIESLFGGETPSRDQVEKALGSLLRPLERGQCHYLMVQGEDGASEVFFAGCSFD